MERTIETQDELKTYLLENEWRPETPHLYRYPMEDEAYNLHVSINPFERKHFYLYMQTPYEIRTEMVFYRMSGKSHPVIEEVESEVRKMKRMYQAWENGRLEVERNKQILYQWLDEKAVMDEENGYEYVPFENGINIVLFLLPKDVGFEASFPMDAKGSEYDTKAYGFRDEAMKQFFSRVQKNEQKVPYLNGWVDPMDKEQYLASYHGETFDSGEGSHIEQAKEFRELLFEHVKHDYLFHLIPFIYNGERPSEDKIEMEIRKEKSHLTDVQGILDVFMELSSSYPFVTHDGQYRYTDILEIHLNQAKREDFTDFAKSLNQKMQAVVERKQDEPTSD